MINVNDLVPSDATKLYRYEIVQPNGTGTGEYQYLKYAPGDLSLTPTPINRALLMGVQGFQGQTTVFNANGSISETNAAGDVKTTVFNSDGSISETFVSGVQSITKTTTFNADGSISEVVS